MSDIFGNQGSKATQAVIDAASKILMGVKGYARIFMIIHGYS